MFPPGHVLVGYLPYSLWCRLRGTRPTGPATWLLVLGTLMPDLIDKTFTWIVPLLPSGRSLAHSTLVLAVVAVPLLALARRRGHLRRWVAFVVGVLSHQVVDAADPIAQGVPADARFLAWPLTSPVYFADDDLWIQIEQFELTTLVGIELLGGLLILALWVADGMPGLPRRSE